MRKDLSFFALAGLLGVASACIIVTDDGDTEGETGNVTSGNTTEAETGATETGATAADTGATAADTGSGGATTATDDTAGAAGCGWGPTGEETIPEGYVCGGEGEDPDGNFRLDCPAEVELVEGGACGTIAGQGCCDADGNAWFCGDDGGGPILVLDPC